MHQICWLLRELDFICCDNQATIFFAKNLTFCEHTKHIDINRHTIYDKVLSSFITTPHVAASRQGAYALTKGSRVASDDSFSRKLGLFDLYTLAGRGRGVSGYSSF